jgi:hypothetical protein
VEAKTCRDCGEAKPLEAFPLQKGGRMGRHPLCKPCRAAQERERYRRDRDAILERARDDPRRKDAARWGQLLRKHGLTKAAYLAMVDAQGATCAICGRVAPLRVDHDHRNGSIRGLLCDKCNLAIGQLGDEPARLRAAAAYLGER